MKFLFGTRFVFIYLAIAFNQIFFPHFIEGLNSDRNTKMSKYDIVLHELSLQKLVSYKNEIEKGEASPGVLLDNEFKKLKLSSHQLSTISAKEFLNILLSTKKPCIFAESAIQGNGRDWNNQELSILGDIDVTMTATIYDNGIWSPRSHDFKVHTPPFEGHLMFAIGALLETSGSFISPDYLEIVDQNTNTIKQASYNSLIERRLLPVLTYANEKAKKDGNSAFVIIPGIGCGVFAGIFRNNMAFYLHRALESLLERHGQNLSNISCVYFDSYSQLENTSRKIHNIQYRVRPYALSNDNRRTQLSKPVNFQEKGDDFSKCTLYKIVAWDHVSLPGNDYFAGSRSTDDGVSAAATNSMEIITGIKGNYANGLYRPPTKYRTWEQVAADNGTKLFGSNNVYVTTQNGQYVELDIYMSSHFRK